MSARACVRVTFVVDVEQVDDLVSALTVLAMDGTLEQSIHDCAANHGAEIEIYDVIVGAEPEGVQS